MSKVDLEHVTVDEVVDDINGEETEEAKVRKPGKLRKVKDIAIKVGIPVGTFILGIVVMALTSKSGDDPTSSGETPALPADAVNTVTFDDGTQLTVF